MMPVLTASEAQARAALVTVVSYDVFLDVGADVGRSRTVVRFKCASPGARTFAELRTPAMLRASLNGAALAQPDGGRLALPELAAENVLEVEAELSPRALSTFTDPADGAVYTLAYTYPTGAPELFCCFDQPGMPAPLALTLRAPAGWTCVANGAVISRPLAGTAGEWRFAPVRLSPYDFTFCAGPFTTTSLAGARVPATVRARAALPEHTTTYLGRFAESARLACERYERDLGIPYAYDKYDIVALPILEAQAACFPGLIVVNEDLLPRLADPDDATAGMIAEHEAAHWWFGGVVAIGWWDDLWLDESMATYVTYTSDAGWASFSWSDKPRAYRADELPTTQPVSSPVETMTQARDRPNAITYVKGTAVVRQLAALIGSPAVTAGLTDYLTRCGTRGYASLDDLVASWSRVSGRDLSGWAGSWLRTSGTPVLRAVLAEAADGTIESLTLTADRPWPQRVSVGLYDRSGSFLRCRRSELVELSGTETVVPAFAGQRLPDAVIVNDRDWAFGHTVFDERSFAALAETGLRVNDPFAEAVCWNAAWHMVLAGELAAADFAALAARRLADGATLTPAATEALLARATACADRYAPATARAGIRETIAEAALTALLDLDATPASRRILRAGFAASAETTAQLSRLRDWLDGPEDGLEGEELSLRGVILRTLAARGLASDADLDTLTAADPVAGATMRATCAAARPDLDAKEAAWTAALAPETSTRMARAHAEGFWVAGQEEIMSGYRDRYFTEALPILLARDTNGERIARRLARLLFPSTLGASDSPSSSGAAGSHDTAGSPGAAGTLEALRAALGSGTVTGYLRDVLLEEAAELQTAATAQAVPPQPRERFR